MVKFEYFFGINILQILLRYSDNLSKTLEKPEARGFPILQWKLWYLYAQICYYWVLKNLYYQGNKNETENYFREAKLNFIVI